MFDLIFTRDCVTARLAVPLSLMEAMNLSNCYKEKDKIFRIVAIFKENGNQSFADESAAAAMVTQVGRWAIDHRVPD